MYPVKLIGDLKERIWGGNNLSSLGKDTKGKSIGESWEAACHKNGESIIATGEYEGYTLCDVINVEREMIDGKPIEAIDFPLLVKFIDACENLSIQVHPKDHYARMEGERYGKNEAWYIISAEENATITIGVKDGYSTEDVIKSIKEGEPERYLNKINVKAGELYYIPSGTIHGIGKGVLVLEVQQNSDLTYRIYDYGRGRELHLDKALEVIDNKSKWLKIDSNKDVYNNRLQKLLETNDFSIHMIKVSGSYKEIRSLKSFELLTCIDGNGVVEHDGGTISLSAGETIFVPIDTKVLGFEGKMTIVKSFANK